MSKRIAYIAFAVLLLVLNGCSTTRHVPDGFMLLDKVDIRVEGDTISTTELYNFLRQQPNHKVLGLAKMQLATYSLAGKDSTKWYNRWLKSLGQPPVIYDQKLTDASGKQLRQALVNRGYMDAVVSIDTIARPQDKKIEVRYLISPGNPHRVSSFNTVVDNVVIDSLLSVSSAIKPLEQGDLFDRNRLDNLRSDITTLLRNKGFYSFSKENISFVADTVAGSKELVLTMVVRADTRKHEDKDKVEMVPVEDTPIYTLGHVYILTDFSTAEKSDARLDTVQYHGLTIVYGRDHYIKPSILEEKCYLAPGQQYSANNVDLTYQGMSQLGIVNFVNVEVRPVAGSPLLLDAYVMLSPAKKQSVSLELEGTNSEGDLGFGIGATYKHRNLAKKSEELTVKFRTAYESLSGNVGGFINNRYSEYAGEVGITFPKFVNPFLSQIYKKKWRSSTEFAISGNYQERPEYTRIIAGAAWKYRWTRQRGQRLYRYSFDLIDINYVRLPKSTLNFLDSVAPTNPLLRYSYEDHFIMRLGFSFFRSNRRVPTASVNAFSIQPSVTTIRGNAEIAGNLLYAISSMIGQKKSDGAYKVFGIQYAQYVKLDADYSYTLNLNQRNAVAFHVGGGIAVPYGNSRMVPFEKRFYAGGANSVRGWGVRTLGPGSFASRNSVTNFINQCGDIELNLNMEYRFKLFWVFEGAAFVDAGNVWTIREYENQRGGVFKFNKFYEQIAAAYGLGLRLDFTYFLLRLDLGVKAHNPAHGERPWPLFHPQWKRDTNFHFSVGYPF